MEVSTVCIFGGSGFVGRHICHRLAALGYGVRIPTRDRERAKTLLPLPTADVVEADVHDPAQTARLIHGAHAVIDLVGVLHPGRGNERFEAAHVELPRKILAACRESGVRRYIHMSALNAGPGAPSAYLRSKGEAEALVRASGLDVTVFRPSVIFGPEDRFLNLFAELSEWLPLIMLGSPDARFQPVFVEDVAAAFVASLTDIKSFGQSYDLCGPQSYTLRELVEYAGRTSGHARPVIGLGDRLSYWQAYAMEWLPVKLLSRDNYYSMKLDSVCGGEFPFGIRPTALEAVAPAWLGHRTPRARYYRYRNQAGR
ncbi:MAG TPA: complex I NDUFA9 subunit family protein [Burkholderiales bacterium]|nr:complex I NDUFA9 subunit family protein [Burkholderiales bacterium]